MIHIAHGGIAVDSCLGLSKPELIITPAEGHFFSRVSELPTKFTERLAVTARLPFLIPPCRQDFAIPRNLVSGIPGRPPHGVYTGRGGRGGSGKGDPNTNSGVRVVWSCMPGCYNADGR